MTISMVGAGAYVATTSIPVTVSPTGSAQTADSLSLIFVAVKTVFGSGEARFAPPSGWTELKFASLNDFVGSGVDTGPVNVSVFAKEGVVGAQQLTLMAPGTPAIIQAQMITYQKGSGTAWAFNASSGIDSSYAANYLTTVLDGNTTAKAFDTVVAFTALNSDAGAVSAPTLTATGVTFGDHVLRADTATTTGDDGRLIISQWKVMSATTQTTPVVVGWTNASSTAGASLVVRLREVPKPQLQITVNPDFFWNPRYQIILTGLQHYTSASVTRRETGGFSPEVSVRGGDLQDTDGASALVLDDYEFSYGSRSGQPLNYTFRAKVYTNNILNVTADSLTFTPLEDWKTTAAAQDAEYLAPVAFLSAPEIPTLNVPIFIEDFNSYSREGNILGQHRVLGKKNPTIVSDVTSGTTGSFAFFVHDFSLGGGNTSDVTVSGAYETPIVLTPIESLFDRGATYMLRTLIPSVSGVPDFFFKLNSVQYERVNRVAAMVGPVAPEFVGKSLVRVTVDFTEVDRPPTLVAPPTFTWQSVKDANTSWAQVRSGVLSPNDSWLDVLTDGA